MSSECCLCSFLIKNIRDFLVVQQESFVRKELISKIEINSWIDRERKTERKRDTREKTVILEKRAKYVCVNAWYNPFVGALYRTHFHYVASMTSLCTHFARRNPAVTAVGSSGWGETRSGKSECKSENASFLSMFLDEWLSLLLKVARLWLKGWDNIGYFCVAVLGHKEHLSLSLFFSRSFTNNKTWNRWCELILRYRDDELARGHRIFYDCRDVFLDIDSFHSFSIPLQYIQ